MEREVKVDRVEVQAMTRRLRQTVKLALARQKPRYTGTEPSALLLRQAASNEIPSALIEDADLAPVDKVIWLVLMLRTSEGNGLAVLPTRMELAKTANVRARETVRKALAMLRCRRWLSVCQSVWRSGGQQRGSAYALHTAPLAIADTLYLDRNYRLFVRKLARDRCARLRKAAQDALTELSARDT